MDAAELASRARGDEGARWAFRGAVGVAVVVWWVVGRRQWFIRDDWALLLTRDEYRRCCGTGTWLFFPQDGHWMTPPIVLYDATRAVFGLGSYWPFLLLVLATHLGAVLLVREVCRRAGATAWTTTIVCSMLLVFGSGWENIVFAVQITYNLSLVGFLAHVLLADHDGPLGRRDALGVAVGMVGVMSSGFAPFFIGGIGLFLLLRGRWRAAAVHTAPLAVAYVWWWLRWGDDPAGDAAGTSATQVPSFVGRGVLATFRGLTSVGALEGVALVATVGVVLWRRGRAREHSLVAALAVTALVMFAGVGLQRAGFGVEGAAASRYVYMAAFLVVPAFCVAVDLLGRLAPQALGAGRVLLAGSALLNAAALHTDGGAWADLARAERGVLELVAGSPRLGEADPTRTPVPFSPDVTVGAIPTLVRDGAIEPRPATTPAELALVDEALGLAPVP